MTNLPAYQNATTNAVLIDQSAIGRFWSTGGHNVDLIHRMSTNDLRNMQVNEGRRTVLTNAHGKIVDLITVINLADRALVLTSPNNGTPIRGYLTRYIFFNDDVKLADATADITIQALVGPKAAALVSALNPAAADLSPHSVLTLNDDVLLQALQPLAGAPAYQLIGTPAALATVADQLRAAGATDADQAILDLLTLEAGYPAPGKEVSSDFIPLEVDLWGAVSFSKGCYIGQEIIARMESRGKLAKTLVGLRSDVALPIGATIKAGKGRGKVTSSLESPTHGWISLGLLKPDAITPGAMVDVIVDGATLSATLADTPFS